MEVRRGKVLFHSIFALSQLPAAAIATWSTHAGYRKPAFLISLADRNGLKNLPRQIFSACVKFGGNPCRDVDTLGLYTHTQKHTHTKTHTHRQSHTHTRMNYILDCVTFHWKPEREPNGGHLIVFFTTVLVVCVSVFLSSSLVASQLASGVCSGFKSKIFSSVLSFLCN